MSSSIVSLLGAHKLFEDMSPSLVAGLAGETALVCVEGGDWLFRHGERATALYLVVSGSLLEQIGMADGGSQKLGRHGAGAMFGETQLLAGAVRGSDVLAEETSTLLRLPIRSVEASMESDALWRKRMRDHLHDRLRTEQLCLVLPPLFGAQGTEVLLDEAQHLEWIDLSRGAVLCSQGERGDGMFVVVNGHLSAEVTQADGATRQVGKIGGGETIGEMALLTGEPRGATVRALRDSQLIRIPRPLFNELAEAHPVIYQAISTLLIARLQRIHTNAAPAGPSLTLAVTPAGSGVDHHDFSRKLCVALEKAGTLLRLDSRNLGSQLSGLSDPAGMALDHPHAYRVTQWLFEQQARHRTLVLECDPAWSPWTERCLIHADLVIRVAEGRSDPELSSVEEAYHASRHYASHTASTLALLHPASALRPSSALPWLASRPGCRH
ncbi:MAG: cyclic nucleotide-binding domain-containing protein, partial [Spirochaetota bacterium]